MSTIRATVRTRFCVVHHDTIDDARLSFKALGLLVWLLDKPDDWRCDASAIARCRPDGRYAILGALKELETAGYLARHRAQDPETHLWSSTTTIREVAEVQFPDVGKPDAGSPDVGKPDAFSVPGPSTETAAAAGAPPVVSTAPALPLSIPEEPVNLVAQACMTAAVASAKAERAAGKKITAIGKYAAPRARDYQAAHGARLATMVAEGATEAMLVAYIEDQGVDPLVGPRPAPAERTGPRLQDLTGLAVQQEFVEPGAEVLDLGGHRAAAAAARARLRGQTAETGS